MLPSDLKLLRTSDKLPRDTYWSSMREHCAVLGDFTKVLAGGEVTQILITVHEITIKTASGLLMAWDVTQLRAPSTLLVIDGEYEAAETMLLTHLAARACTFVDVGANIGYYSLALAHAAPNLVVCSIEPAADTRTRLLRNIELNALSARINVVAMAIGDEPGTALLYKPSVTGNVGASLADLHPDEPTDTESVSVGLLDDVVKAFLNKERDVLLKMDVEGAEERAIKGATKTLDSCFAVVVELSRKWLAEFGARATDVVDLMKQAGFGCFAIELTHTGNASLTPTIEITEETRAVNFLFLHESVASDIAQELRQAGFVISLNPS